MDNLTTGALNYPLSTDRVELPELARRKISIDVLRLDKIHPVLSGNKWFKLQGWLALASPGSGPAPRSAPKQPFTRHIVTFGGAWSNHIVAAAYAAQQAGLTSTGFIRGEKPALLSDTLLSAAGYGMQLEYLSRAEYANKNDPGFLQELAARFPGACIIPEGGAGPLGIKGSKDILLGLDSSHYSHILCAVGTGTMYLGLAAAAAPEQYVIGMPVLKGLKDLPGFRDLPVTRQIIPDYHFGGYARKSPDLLDFMNYFHRATGIPSDFVYTGKLFYGVMDMAGKNLFPAGSHLLVVHSGGLQGNRSLPPGTLEF